VGKPRSKNKFVCFLLFSNLVAEEKRATGFFYLHRRENVRGWGMQRCARAIVVLACLSLLAGVDAYAGGISKGDTVFKDGARIGIITAVNGKSVTFVKPNGLSTSTTTDNLSILGLTIRKAMAEAKKISTPASRVEDKLYCTSVSVVKQPSGKPDAVNEITKGGKANKAIAVRVVGGDSGSTIRSAGVDIEIKPSEHGNYDVKACESFKQGVIDNYGFTEQAKAYLRTVSLVVARSTWNSSIDGGAHWHVDRQEINSSGWGEEGAVHEMAHAWYDQDKSGRPWTDSELLRATQRLAAMDPARNARFADAIKEARQYVADARPAFEVFASFASFAKAKNGGNAMPEFMNKFYASLFAS